MIRSKLDFGCEELKLCSLLFGLSAESLNEIFCHKKTLMGKQEIKKDNGVHVAK
jgi:hypothetical protein